MAQIAKSMQVSRFAAIFSINSAIQNMVQVIIQFIIGKSVLNLKARQQFQVFGYCSFGSALGLSVMMIVHKSKQVFVQRKVT